MKGGGLGAFIDVAKVLEETINIDFIFEIGAPRRLDFIR